MTSVSINRAEMSLKNLQGDPVISCVAKDDKNRYEMKTIIMPIRNAVNSCGSVAQRGSVDQSGTSRQTIIAPVHSYSSDSDVVSNIIATSTATTAMRRLYFKSAKLSKTTQNSITTVHQQQAQHVPKVRSK